MKICVLIGMHQWQLAHINPIVFTWGVSFFTNLKIWEIHGKLFLQIYLPTIQRNSNKQILEDYQWTILEQKTIPQFSQLQNLLLDENIIWVGTDDGNVQVTKDGGKNWQNVVSNIQGLPSNTWTYHIEASVHGKGTAYAVFDGHNSGDMQPYVYKTIRFWNNLD